MATKIDYAKKFESFHGRTLFEYLPPECQAFIREIAFECKLTFQEFRRVTEIARDLDMWGEPGLEEWWKREAPRTRIAGQERTRRLLQRLDEHVANLRRHPGRYPDREPFEPEKRPPQPVVTRRSDKAIWGMCPVASEKTVCCNLRTVDAVENCVFACSYCTVQTFYTDNIVIDQDVAAKLATIELDPDRFYHFGSGQASDSLAWGNKGGILDALCHFAADHPNVLLELKSKSANVRYLLENEIPENVVCSWSLNTPAVIENEEHFTAGLDARFDAARAVADRGVSVAFHFHPMVNYDGWGRDYTAVARRLLERFRPEEVLFISIGSVTLIKPVIRRIREQGSPSRILQTELVPDPHGKLTYTDDTKVEMFRTIYDALAPWHNGVFMYLCMEKRSIWERVFGYSYSSNEEFETEFGCRTLWEGR